MKEKLQIKNLERQLSKFQRKIKRTRKAFVSILKMEAHEAVSVALRFSHFQLKIRPRLRVILKAVAVLAIAFIASSRAVAYLEPKEAEIKINGQTILVAEDKPVPEAGKVGEIVQSINALRSPFMYEKPVDGQISQGFSRYHRALDIAISLGTPIRPVGPGIVEFAGFEANGKGNVVIVDHGDGLKTLYAHMGKIFVGTGNMVGPDTALGTVGLTGHTTGPHVHFEVYDKGVAVNPLNLLP